MSGKIIDNLGRSSGLVKAAAAGGAASTVAASTTVGDGSEEDTKIVFDGHALDFRIGIDDGTDTLEIGKGNAHGTTAHMTFDTNGIILKPLQPAFLVQKSGSQDNVAINTLVTVTFDTERFDNNADFASNTFTAPVTGKYFVDTSLYLSAFDEGAAYYQIYLRTSNRDYANVINSGGLDTDGFWTLNVSHVVDMDASDTCYVSIYQSGGTAQTDIGTTSVFSGYLLG